MPQRVLFVTTPTYIGGAEISLLTLIQHLSAECYEPSLLTSGESSLSESAQAAKIPTLFQNFPWFSRRRPWQYMHSIYQLVKTIKIQKIDLIHTNCDHSLGYVMYASRLSGVPYVSHVRDFVRTWFQPEKVAALNRASKVIANSQAMVKACVKAGIHADRIVCIYNPVDIEKFQSNSPVSNNHLRKQLGIPSDALVIGLVGQIQPIKGHQEFVRAGIQLAVSHPEIHFLIVGAAPPYPEGTAFLAGLQAEIASSTCASRFHLTGFSSDIVAVMQTIDILAIPSWAEPFGRVAVEGMAAGCAVVGTNIGGLPEIITNNNDGLLVPPKDVDALRIALHRLITNSDLRQQLAERGRRTAQRFTIANHVEQIEALYDLVLDRNKMSHLPTEILEQ